jgi:hypothetical protein
MRGLALFPAPVCSGTLQLAGKSTNAVRLEAAGAVQVRAVVL